jgi:hypothetical protein
VTRNDVTHLRFHPIPGPNVLRVLTACGWHIPLARTTPAAGVTCNRCQATRLYNTEILGHPRP